MGRAPRKGACPSLFMREDRKKALSLVIGKEPLLIADYFEWVDVLKISR